MGISDLLDRARLVMMPDEESLPPVPDDASSLLEDEDVLPPDPKPGKPRRAKSTRAGAWGKATAAQKRQVADALFLIQSIIGGGLQLRDPVCGGAILENAQNVADKAVPIICRNPAWLRWFTESTGFLDVIALLVALQPVGATIWRHHVTHTVSHEEGGESAVDYSAYAVPSL
jgi:hypothetical protein